MAFAFRSAARALAFSRRSAAFARAFGVVMLLALPVVLWNPRPDRFAAAETGPAAAGLAHQRVIQQLFQPAQEIQTLEIGQTLDFEVSLLGTGGSVDFTIEETAPWLSVDPTQGTTPASTGSGG